MIQNEDNNEWTARFNIGFFHKEKAMNPVEKYKNLFIDYMEEKSIQKENYCKIKPKYFSHFLFKGTP